MVDLRVELEKKSNLEKLIFCLGQKKLNQLCLELEGRTIKIPKNLNNSLLKQYITAKELDLLQEVFGVAETLTIPTIKSLTYYSTAVKIKKDRKQGIKLTALAQKYNYSTDQIKKILTF